MIKRYDMTATRIIFKGKTTDAFHCTAAAKYSLPVFEMCFYCYCAPSHVQKSDGRKKIFLLSLTVGKSVKQVINLEWPNEKCMAFLRLTFCNNMLEHILMPPGMDY